MYGLKHRPQCHPRPPARPPPPPPHPSPHHTNSAPPTPRRLRTIQHHRGPARHRAPIERASKRAAQRQATQHHTATGIQGHRASPAGSGAIPNPTNTRAVGTQPEQPPGTANPHREPAPSPTGSPQPLAPPVAPAHGPRPAASQAAATQAHLEPRPHHGTPDRPAAGPAYATLDGPPTQAQTATPTDTTAVRPSDTVHPRTPGPTQGLIPQAPATSGAEDLSARTHDGPAPQRHHAPPTGPTARPAEPSSPGWPAPGPGPGPGPARTAALPGAPQPAGPGSRPEPPPVAEGHARGATQPTNNEAEPPALPT